MSSLPDDVTSESTIRFCSSRLTVCWRSECGSQGHNPVRPGPPFLTQLSDRNRVPLVRVMRWGWLRHREANPILSRATFGQFAGWRPFRHGGARIVLPSESLNSIEGGGTQRAIPSLFRCFPWFGSSLAPSFKTLPDVAFS